jgi:acetoin utilization deacetylase AcuC-like enzyme
MDSRIFTGFEDETGSCQGEKCNVNFTLKENIDGQRYREILQKALKIIRKFQPQFLVLALGFDTAKGDPTGSWSLNARDFEMNGKLIGTLNLPILVVQEGGYNNRNLGINARHFFKGLWQAMSLWQA